VTIVFQQHDVPAAIRSLGSLPRVDYVDLFTVVTDGAAGGSPEQWAHAGLEDAAGLAGQFVWRVLCGLRLERQPSPGHIAGWKIVDHADRWIRLEAASSFMTAQLVVQVDDGQVSIATFIRYDLAVAAVIWPAISVGHRQAMPGLLRNTVRAMAQGRPHNASRRPDDRCTRADTPTRPTASDAHTSTRERARVTPV
jgi:hypothetical protein